MTRTEAIQKGARAIRNERPDVNAPCAYLAELVLDAIGFDDMWKEIKLWRRVSRTLRLVRR